MIALIITLAGLFTYLLYETDWLKIRLPQYAPIMPEIPELKLGYAIEGFNIEPCGDPLIDSALDDIASYLERCQDLESLCNMLDMEMNEVETELGLRCLPYHGGAKALFPGVNTKQLNQRWHIYREFGNSIVASES